MRFVARTFMPAFTFGQRLFKKLFDGEGAKRVTGAERAAVACGHGMQCSVEVQCGAPSLFEVDCELGGVEAVGQRTELGRRDLAIET